MRYVEVAARLSAGSVSPLQEHGLVSLRVVTVEENPLWRTDSPEIALLEVGSDALAEAIGAPLARGIEPGLGTWEGCDSCCRQVGTAAYPLSSEPSPPGVRPSH
jgi:hypothetical protein